MQVSHRFTAESAVFDSDNLVSCAGLVPVMAWAEQTGLPALLAENVAINCPRIASGSANPAPKLVTLIAGICAGADSIDDVDVLRSGGAKTVFDRVYAPSTIGTLLREFTLGHTRQLDAVLRAHLVALSGRVELLPGLEQRAFVDIDSLLRPVSGLRTWCGWRSAAQGFELQISWFEKLRSRPLCPIIDRAISGE